MRLIALSACGWLAVASAAHGQAADAPPIAYAYAPYNAGRMDPQLVGWPPSEAERAYALRPEHDRRPGREANRHLPAMWPVTPSAGSWGGTTWLDLHAKLAEAVASRRDPVDVLLVGDSITMQWGPAWARHFPDRPAVNLGIGGDKTQNVLWRLDHGGVAGLAPRVVVLMIGNNNMFFAPETGIEPAARGIAACAANLRARFPDATLVVADILPAHAPGDRFYEDIKKTNAALDALKLDADPKVRRLRLWPEFVNPDGTLKAALYTPDRIHLTQEGGYALYAERLRPLLARPATAAAPPVGR
jgi:lysophospholipase L1-like esterase